MLYNRNTNTRGKIIKHNLRTSRKERTHFFIKIYLSHFILKRVDVSVMCERWVERHILRERTSSHIFFQEPGGANPLVSLSDTPLLGCVCSAWQRFSALCPNLTTWFSSRGLLPVTYLFDLSDQTCCHLPVY